MTLAVIYALLVLSVSFSAQEKTTPLPPVNVPAAADSQETTPDMKQLVSEETQKLNQDSARFDPVAIDKAVRKQTTKKGWTTTQKTWLVLGIIGFAVLMFVLIKYGKDCVRSSPEGCTPGVDELCTCQEYAQNH